jgi:hypothetical protein
MIEGIYVTGTLLAVEVNWLSLLEVEPLLRTYLLYGMLVFQPMFTTALDK